MKAFSSHHSQEIDVDVIQKDLSVAGIGETLIQSFDELKSVGSHEYLETDDNVVEYTESRVRSLEKYTRRHLRRRLIQWMPFEPIMNGIALL